MEQFRKADFWEKAKTSERFQEILAEFLQTYEEKKDAEITCMPEEGWALSKAKIVLSVPDKVYFDNRNFAERLALLSLIYPEKDEYLKLLEKYLHSICGEYAWAVPAHCMETDDDVTCVDLYASETSCMLAEILLLLEDRLDKMIVEKVKSEVNRRVFVPFQNNTYWWEGGWNNWTSVCLGNVGMAMMSLAPEIFEKESERIIKGIMCYIDGFPDDGSSLEGVGYWTYGVSAWVWFAEKLYRYTDGKVDLFNNEKVERIASYIQKVYMKGDICPSFSDGTEKSKVNPTLQSFLCEKYPNSCKMLPRNLSQQWNANVRWVSLTRTLLYGLYPKYAEKLQRENHLFKDSGQCFINEDDYTLFVKAGFNEESHNHNDIGSFIFSTKIGQIFCDLGPAKYFVGYFDPNIRYKMLTTSSNGHSVPIIDGGYQKFGKEYRGEMWQDGNTVFVDCAKAYDRSVGKFLRKFTYDKTGVTLFDEFDGKHTVVERFVTLKEPKLMENGVKVGNVVLTCKDATPVISSIKNTEMKDEPIVYFIDYTFEKAVVTMFRMEIVEP